MLALQGAPLCVRTANLPCRISSRIEQESLWDKGRYNALNVSSEMRARARSFDGGAVLPLSVGYRLASLSDTVPHIPHRLTVKTCDMALHYAKQAQHG